MGNAEKAQGTTIGWYNGSAYDLIGEVTVIDGPTVTKEPMDVTNLDSSAKEVADPGLYDPGEISIEFNVYGLDTGQLALWTDFIAGTIRNVQVTRTDAAGTTFTQEGIVTSIGTGSAAVGEKVTGSATIKLSGAITKA